MNDAHVNDTVDTEESPDFDLGPEIADAVCDFLTDAGIEVAPDEARMIANEIVEKFTSPLMMQRAAGATSQVSVVNAPNGGVESARSTKLANFVYNIKSTALAIPVPALAGVLARTTFTTNLRIVMGAIAGIFAFLSTLANALNIPLTKQAAGILQFMWTISDPETDIVPHKGLLEKVNTQFESFKWRAIDAEELISYLEALEKIGCLERATSYNSIAIERIQWHLREEVKPVF